MAQDQDIFAPTAQAQVQSPNDTFHQQATPADFGAPIAQGAEKLGAGLEQAGQFWGQVQTDGQLNGAYKQGEQLVAAYKNTRGPDAVKQQQQIRDQIAQTFQDAGSQLKTPAQKLQFDNASRTYMDRFLLSQVDQHANQQGQQLAHTTFTDGMNRTVGQTAMVAGDQDHVDALADHAVAYSLDAATALYGPNMPDEIRQSAISTARAAVYKQQIETLAADPKTAPMAMTALERNKADLGAEYPLLQQRIKASVNDGIGQQAFQEALARTGQTFLGGQQPNAPQPIPNAAAGGSPNWEVSNNNFAGIRKPGVTAGPNAGGFQSFSTPEEGVAAVDRLLTSYQDQHGLNTIAGIVNRWAPPSDHNDTATLIQNASKWTGFAPNQPIDLHDPAVKEPLITAMIRNEQGGNLPVSPNVIHAVSQGLVGSSGPASTLPSAALKAGLYDQLLQDPRLADNPAAFQVAVRAANEHATVASIASMQNEAAQKQQREAEGTSIVNDVLNRKPDNYTQRIANSSLTYEAKLALNAGIEKYVQQDLGKDTVTDGPKIWDVYQRIHLPDGDPNKITSPTQLYAMGPTGDLTLSGIDRLTKELAAKGTVSGEAEASMRNQFLKTARGEITGSSAHMGWEDPQGDAQFTKFLGQFWPQYQQGREAGISPQDLLTNTKSKDYLGGDLIAGFKRTPAQQAADMGIAAGGAQASAPAGPSPLLRQADDLAMSWNAVSQDDRQPLSVARSKMANDLVSAVMAGKIPKAEADARLKAMGYVDRSDVDPLPVAR
jgi:hypothetical protein